MKKKIYVVFSLFVSSFAFSQEKVPTTVEYIPCLSFRETPPLSELIALTPQEEELDKDKKAEEIRRKYFPPVNPNALPKGEDPIVQKTNGTRAAHAPLVNFAGLGNTSDPADPSGAPGPNHYVQAVNCKYRIFTKTGGTVTNGGPFNLNVLWPGSGNEGDPIVLYDKYADRWFISQFNDPDKILVAVSKTNDPTGAYYAYTFIPQSGKFPDYPKYSIWPEAYICTANIGNPGNMAAFDRTKMIAGNASAGMIKVSFPSAPNAGFFCPLSADADGQLPPNGTPCPLFTYEDDSWSSGGVDQLRIYDFKINWANPTSSTITLNTKLPVAAFNVDFNSGWNDIPQPGSSTKLDAINGVLTYRAQYRVWTGYNTAVVCHSVITNTSTKQVGIRWYELRQNASGVWSIYQQGTYAPGTESRWLGSIAMDDNGNIGMCYATGGTVAMSLRYTGRYASDLLGQMTLAEETAIAGSGAKNSNRAGDYSQTSLDPDGVTFWHTGMYVSSGSIATRVYSFKISGGVGINEIASNIQLNTTVNNEMLDVKAKGLQNETDMQLDLFELNGKLVNGQKVKANNGEVNAFISLNGLSKGMYLVRLGNSNFQKVIKVQVN